MDQIEAAKQHLRFLAEADGQLNGPTVYLWQKMRLRTWEEAKEIMATLEAEGFVLPRTAREDGYRSLPPQHWVERKYPKRHYAHKKYWRAAGSNCEGGRNDDDTTHRHCCTTAPGPD